MRSRSLAVGLAVTVVVAALIWLTRSEDRGPAEAGVRVPAAVTTTRDFRVQAEDDGRNLTAPPAPPSSTNGTSEPRTTSQRIPTTTVTTTADTSPPTAKPTPTTNTTVPGPADSDYVPIPKPAGGTHAIAPGGALTKHLAADIAAVFGFGLAEVEAAIAGVELPPEAGGNPEGWLAPGSYEPDESVEALVQTMVDRRVVQLESRGVPRERWYRVLTAASVIEKETYNQNEKPQVARVLTNRLVGGGPLQMDSIILYPVPEDRIFTTSAERASDQPYNSYKHSGLPPTPICSPDEASIDAFLAPPPGDWWFYVTIDLDSGETRYAATYEEHLDNVELLRAWLREHPTP